MERKNKIGLIAVFVIAGFLGLSGLGISYWYSNIKDVTPQYSEAEDFPGSYVAAKKGSNEGYICPGDFLTETGIGQASFSKKGVFSGGAPIFEGSYSFSFCNKDITDGSIDCNDVLDTEKAQCNLTTFNPTYCENIFFTQKEDDDKVLAHPLDRNVPVNINVEIINDVVNPPKLVSIKYPGDEGDEYIVENYDLSNCGNAGTLNCTEIFGDEGDIKKYLLAISTYQSKDILPKDISGSDGKIYLEVEIKKHDDSIAIDGNNNIYCKRVYPVLQPEITLSFGEIVDEDLNIINGNKRVEKISLDIKNSFFANPKTQLKIKVSDDDETTEDETYTSKDITLTTVEDENYYQINIPGAVLYAPNSDLFSPSFPTFVAPETGVRTYTLAVEYMDEDGNFKSAGTKDIKVSAIEEDNGDDGDDDDGEDIDESTLTCTLNAVTPLTGIGSLELSSANFSINNITDETEPISFKFSIPEAGVSGKATDTIEASAIATGYDPSKGYTIELSAPVFIDDSAIILNLPQGETSRTYNVSAQLAVGEETVSCTGARAVTLTADGVIPTTTTNISVTKTGGSCVERVSPRNRINFTINVQNTGTTKEIINTITDKLPLGFTYVADSSTLKINNVDVSISKEPQVNSVGSAQQLVWNLSTLSGIDNGNSAVITFSANAGPQSLTGQNQNEVVVAIPNMPADPSSLRTEFVFRVQQSCLSPKTGIFDSVVSKIIAGSVFVLLAMIIFLYKGGYFERHAESKLFLGIDNALDGVETFGLKFLYPKRYFKKKVQKEK